MSLDDHQRHVTSAELHANLERAGLDIEQLAERVGIPTAAITDALGVAPGIDPVLVWRLRDELESAARTAGAQPVPYTYLPEDMRAAAQNWFGVGDHRRRVTDTG